MTPLPHVVPFEYMKPSPLHLRQNVYEAASRLGGYLPRQGYVLEAIHSYHAPEWWVCRWKNHTTGEKRPLPMRRTGTGFEQKRPEFGPDGGPLYKGWNPWTSFCHPLKGWNANNKHPAIVLIVEGEWVADWLACLGFPVYTWPGGAGNVGNADFRTLAGLWVVLWPDNDVPGIEAMDKVRRILEELGCVVMTLDVDALALPLKGDAVQWIERFVVEHGAEDLADIPGGKTLVVEAMLQDWKVAA